MPTELSSLRKKQLKTQLCEAIEYQNQEQILLLESYWVHRYGIKSLKNLYAQSEENETQVLPSSQTLQDSDGEYVYQEDLLSQLMEEPLIDNKVVLEKSNYEQSLNELKESSSSVDSKLNGINSLVDGLSSKEVDFVAPPPPSPAIQQFRRWLPNDEDSIPKAS